MPASRHHARSLQAVRTPLRNSTCVKPPAWTAGHCSVCCSCVLLPYSTCVDWPGRPHAKGVLTLKWCDAVMPPQGWPAAPELEPMTPPAVYPAHAATAACARHIPGTQLDLGLRCPKIRYGSTIFRLYGHIRWKIRRIYSFYTVRIRLIRLPYRILAKRPFDLSLRAKYGENTVAQVTFHDL
jgi:hypothetical protein